MIQINDEFDRIKQEFIKFRVKFRNFMNTQLETFDDLERDLNKNYSIATPIDEFMPKEIGYNEEVVDEVVEDVQADDLDEIKSFFASDVE